MLLLRSKKMDYFILVLIFLIVITYIIIRIPSLYGSKENTLPFNGLTRKYLLHLPKGYDKNIQYPLVLVFHGYSNSPKIAEWYSGFSRKANQEDFIVAYPRGTGEPWHLSWNAGFCCEYGAKEKIDDVGFVTALVNELVEKYPINASRVYATGFSNGAMMVHRLGAEIPEVFAAIAPVSGSIGASGGQYMTSFTMPKPAQPLPIVMLHGEKDTVVPFGGGANYRGDFLPFEKSVQFWLQANNATGSATQKEEIDASTIKTTYVGGTPVVTYVYASGTHKWFGGNYEKLRQPFMKHTPATDVIWDFFKAHTK